MFLKEFVSDLLCQGKGDSNSSAFLIFTTVQELLKDIAVNFLSDALWALGGFIIARLAFLKKSSLFRISQLQKYTNALTAKQAILFKKNHDCDLLLKKLQLAPYVLYKG